MDWLAQFRTLLGMTPAPTGPAYASNFGGSFVQRGISVITAPFAPPVLDPGQAGYYNGAWFSNPAPISPVVLDPGQSLWAPGGTFTAPGGSTGGLSDLIGGL